MSILSPIVETVAVRILRRVRRIRRIKSVFFLPPVRQAVAIFIDRTDGMEEIAPRNLLLHAVGARPGELESGVSRILEVFDSQVVEPLRERQRNLLCRHRLCAVIVDDQTTVEPQPGSVVRIERQRVTPRIADA